MTTAFDTKINGLFKKTDYDTKVRETEKKILDHNHDKYIATREFIRLIADNFPSRLYIANLATKSDIDDFVEKTDFHDKLKNLIKIVTSNKKKHAEVEGKLTDVTKKIAQI